MALDIAKYGRKPYQKLEQPEARDASGVHIRRYFSGLFGRLAGVLVPGGAFFALAWTWNFGVVPGFGRYTAWLMLSGALFVVFSWYALLTRGFKEQSAIPEQYRTIALAVVFTILAFGIGSFARLGLLGALGFSAASSELSWLGALLGAAWLCALLYGTSAVPAIKRLLVSIFLGSTALVLQLGYTLAFGGGYADAEWVLRLGVPLVLAVVAFLMVAFAMFQKRSVKLLWTTSIALHLAVLFAWDLPAAWLVLIIGVSALLVFQMLYSKKLWQRNFTYPLQVWGLAVLLLIIPVKSFTGSTAPGTAALSYESARSAVSSQGFSWFGSGLGSSNEYAAALGVSFDDFGSLDNAAVPAVGHGYLDIYLASGIFGLLAWLALLACALVFGVRFWRANLRSFKEGTMPEGAYLGAVMLVALALLSAGLWFFSFSFLAYWLVMLAIGSGMALWHAPSGPSAEAYARKARSKVLRSGRVRALLLGIGALIAVAYSAFFVFQIRGVRAQGAAARAAMPSADVVAAVALWQRVTALAPWDPMYRLHEAQSLLGLLATPLSIDDQRASLERITFILASETRESRNPITHWRAARLYGQLEAYAEGSALLGREEYQKAQALWPANVVLAVALSEFYRTSVDALVSGQVSAAELKLEARDALIRALALVPEYLPARLELAFLKEQEEGIAAALAELEPWEDASPQIMYHIGRLYLNDGSTEQAVEKLEAAIREVPNHSNAHYSLGVAYFRLERYEESLSEFRAVLELNPGSEDVAAKIEQVEAKLGE